MKRTLMILMVTALALAFWVPGYADVDKNVATSSGTYEDGYFWDWWYSPWIPVVGSMNIGGGTTQTATFTMTPGGITLTDSGGDDDESFHLRARWTGTGSLTFSATTSDGAGNPIAGLGIGAGTALPSGGYNSGNIQAGSGTNPSKLVLAMTAVGGDVFISDIMFGYDSGHINFPPGGGPVPEPATIISSLLGLLGFALRKFRKA